MSELVPSIRHGQEPAQHLERGSGRRPAPRARRARALRVALVENGRIVEERVIERRAVITVGEREDCVFVVARQMLPPSMRLLEYDGKRLYLCWLEGMLGRVATGGRVEDFGAL